MSQTVSRATLRSNRIAILVLATATMSLMGCGMGPSFVNSPSNAAISGLAHGGRQPISGATVTIWSPGTTGYGSAATLLATKSTLSNGTFSFAAGDYTASCTASQPVYITVQGGNPGNSTGNSNPDILLAAPLGICGSLASFTNVNEVTTVATAFALSGFINSANFGVSGASVSDAIGTTYSASPTNAANNNNVTGMTNAFNTIFNLVNPSTGATPGTSSNATVDTGKIVTMANILAACVNSDPTNGDTICSTLFGEVSPTSATATPTAANTFEAAYYLATNPTSMAGSTSNLAAVYTTALPNAPYSGGLTGQPTDWTIGVNYAVSGLSAAQRLAIDNSGDVWVTSSGQITELSPAGAVLTTKTGTLGSKTITNPYGVAINTAGSVLVTDYGNNTIYQLTSSGSLTQAISGATATGEEPYAIGIDGSNNAWITEMTGAALTTVANSDGILLVECAFASSAYCTSTTNPTSPINTSGGFGVAIDTSGTIWSANEYSLSSSTFAGNVRNWPGVGQTGSSTNYYGSTPSKSYFATGIVFDASNNMWYSNGAYSSIGCANCGSNPAKSFVGHSALIFSSGAITTVNTTPTVSAAGAGGLYGARFLAIDGAGSVWIANGSANNSAYSISEFNNAGTAVSPASTGFVHTMVTPNDIAVDGSGNVWVVSSGAAYVTEIVGAGAPAVTPIAYCTKYSTWGQKP